MKSRKAVGSLIGIGFLLMIISVGFTYYQVINRIQNSNNDIIASAATLDRNAAEESLEIQRVRLNGVNSLNLTIKNTGGILSQLEWIGVFDDTQNTKDYYRVNTSLNPVETLTNIGNSSITINPLNSYTIQILTKLGNIYHSEYPEIDIGGGSGTGNSTGQYYIDYSQVDLHPNATVGTHSFFAAMKGLPDSLLNNLTESAVTILPPTEDFVDNNSSDVDSSADKGTHLNFNNQKASDGSMDTLTEEDTWSGAYNGTVLIQPTSFNDVNNRWSSESNAYDLNNATSSTETQQRIRNDIYWNTWNNTEKGTIVRVDLHIRLDLTGLNNDYLTIQWWVGASQGVGTYTINSGNQGTDLKFSFLDVAEPNDGIWSSVDIGNIEIRQVGTKVGSDDGVTYATDEVWGNVTYLFSRYELDLEVQFTSVDTTTYNFTDLCILTGTGDAEDILVQLWNGSASEWNTIFSDLTGSSWNNYTFKSGDTGFGSTTSLRFLGGTDTSDSTQSDWDIDAVLLRQYDGVNFVLDLEAQFTGLPQASNEYLSIFGAVQGAENLRVDIWDGIQYVTVIPDIQTGWNHVNVSSYHTGTIFNIRFKDTVQLGDSVRNQWEIDALYLNLWD